MLRVGTLLCAIKSFCNDCLKITRNEVTLSATQMYLYLSDISAPAKTNVAVLIKQVHKQNYYKTAKQNKLLY